MTLIFIVDTVVVLLLKKKRTLFDFIEELDHKFGEGFLTMSFLTMATVILLIVLILTILISGVIYFLSFANEVKAFPHVKWDSFCLVL